MSAPTLAAWHAAIASGDPAALRALLAEEACFHSPVVHRPQQGRELAALYLGAAFQVFAGTDFRYVREITSDTDAALEFTATIDGIVVNGVDLIHWNAEGRISDFKVMIRPWKAIEKIREKMAAMLESMQAGRMPP
jgi:hypothetical protein